MEEKDRFPGDERWVREHYEKMLHLDMVCVEMVQRGEDPEIIGLTRDMYLYERRLLGMDCSGEM